MNGARDQFFPSSAFSGDQNRCARVFQARNHAQHVLNLGRNSDYAVKLGFCVGTLAQKFVFLDQLNFVRHSSQEQTQFLDCGKRLCDVVVGAKLHRLHCSFNRTVAGHHRNFSPRQDFSHFLQKFNAGHLRHDQIGKNDVRRLLFEERKRFVAIAGRHTCKPQATSNSDT